MDSRRVSVVIPTFNQERLLAACLESLRVQTFRDFEVIVVDDASTDHTRAMLAAQFPEVQVCGQPVNGGFCHTVNTGIGLAGGELVVLLNDDMTLDSPFLEALVAAADAHPEYALFAPLILWRDEPSVIYGAGDIQCASGRPESLGFRTPVEGFRFEEEVFGVCAGAAMYRAEVFDRIGLFDAKYRVYFSDSDLSFRARLAGYRARFVRDAVARHVGSASLSGRTLSRTRQCYVNHLMLLVKNMPAPLLVRHAPAIARERLHQARRVFSAARNEEGAAYAVRMLAATWLRAVSLLPRAVWKRRYIQRHRRISLGELDRMLKP